MDAAPTTARPRKARHLIDFDAPPAPVSHSSWSLTRVQRWVMSTLVVITALHMAAGVSAAAMTLDIPKVSAQVGLNVIAVVFGVLGVAGGLAIHQQRVLSWWLALGVVPGAIGMWLTLR